MQPLPPFLKVFVPDDKRFCTVVVISMLFFFAPLILNNYYHRDDFIRILHEKPQLAVFGRLIGEGAAFLFSADWQWMSDTAPLFLFISLIISAACIIAAINIRAIAFSKTNAAIIVASIFNPFYIQCMLFRIDCLTMAIAYGAAILAWAVFHKRPVSAFILCCISVASYQPFINIFSILVFIEALYRIYQGDTFKIAWKIIAKGIAIAIPALLLYLLINHFLMSDDISERGTFILKNADAAKLLIRKLEGIYARYFGFLSLTGQILYTIAILIALTEIHLHFYKDTRYTKPVLRSALSTICLILFLPLSLGVLLFMEANDSVRARTIVASILFSSILIFLVINFCKRFKGYAVYFIVLLFLIPPLSFSYILNNDVHLNYQYTRYNVEKLASELEDMDQERPIYLSGSFDWAPLIKKNIKRVRLALHMVGASGAWVIAPWLHQYNLKNVIIDDNPDYIRKAQNIICTHKQKAVSKHAHYIIYDMGDSLYVHLGTPFICS